MDQYLVQLLDGRNVVRRIFFPIDHRTCPMTLVQISLAKLWQNDPFTESFPDSAVIHRIHQPDDRRMAEIEEFAVVDVDAEAVFDDLLSRQNRLFRLQYSQRLDRGNAAPASRAA